MVELIKTVTIKLNFLVLKNIKGRIYSENWSMTYVEGDGILKCIKSAIKLAESDTINTNEDCKKFVFEVI